MTTPEEYEHPRRGRFGGDSSPLVVVVSNARKRSRARFVSTPPPGFLIDGPLWSSPAFRSDVAGIETVHAASLRRLNGLSEQSHPGQQEAPTAVNDEGFSTARPLLKVHDGASADSAP